MKSKKIGNNDYVMVFERIKEFRANFPGWSLETEIVSQTDKEIIIKTYVKDESGKIHSTGIAKEVQGDSKVNITSHVENCETSSIGRALGIFGIGIDSSLASAEEVVNAINEQNQVSMYEYAEKQRDVFLRLGEEALSIKNYFIEEEYKRARDLWLSLGEENQEMLWVAPAKGGLFTTEERQYMKTGDFRRGESNVSE